MLVEGHGLPIAVVVAQANENDGPLLEITLRRRLVGRQRGIHLCLDAAYDSKAIRALLSRFRIRPHIRSRRQEADEKRHRGAKARRWMVERCHSWMNRYRRLLVRWEKRADTYLGMIQLACASICFQQLRFFG